jgi:hypothetical protein
LKKEKSVENPEPLRIRHSGNEIGKLSRSINQMIRGLIERNRIRDIFGRYVSKEIREAILMNKVAMKGEKKMSLYCSWTSAISQISLKDETLGTRAIPRGLYGKNVRKALHVFFQQSASRRLGWSVQPCIKVEDPRIAWLAYANPEWSVQRKHIGVPGVDYCTVEKTAV